MTLDNRNVIKPLVPDLQNNVINYNANTESEYFVSFSGLVENCCIGVVDIVDSTRISAGLDHASMAKYYSVFLNSMCTIAKNYGANVIKSIGDSILYSFPVSDKSENDFAFRNCLECGLSMIQERENINSDLSRNNLPSLSFRISSDYGNVMLAKSPHNTSIDIFGPSVNICTKINGKAEKNTMVIGGDLYQIVKKFSGYFFREIEWYDVGLRNKYPIYVAQRAWR